MMDGGFLFVPALTPEEIATLKAAWQELNSQFRSGSLVVLESGITTSPDLEIKLDQHAQFSGPEIVIRFGEPDSDQPHIISGGDS